MEPELLNTQIADPLVTYTFLVGDQEMTRTVPASKFDQYAYEVDLYTTQVAEDRFEPYFPTEEEVENDRKQFFETLWRTDVKDACLDDNHPFWNN